MSPPGVDRPTGESVLARVVRILSAFGPNRRELGVAEVARRADLHVATASRLISQLVELGLLSRTESGRVEVGLQLWELGQRASPTLSLREAALPFLGDLHAVVGQHVQLGVLDGVDVIFLERLSAPGAVVNYAQVAGRLPLHASSTGLVLLAYSSVQLQEQILSSPLPRLTRATITDPRELRARLAAIRRDNAVVVRGHLHPGVTGIAVPVRDKLGSVVAALSTTQPIDGPADALVPALRAAAHGITRAYASGRFGPPA